MVHDTVVDGVREEVVDKQELVLGCWQQGVPSNVTVQRDQHEVLGHPGDVRQARTVNNGRQGAQVMTCNLQLV